MRLLLGILVFSLTTISLTAQQNVRSLGQLPDLVKETSGLLLSNEVIITHNDSGGNPELYEIDTLSLAIKRTITIANAAQKDWEDLAEDDDYIYIGDFGNNRGDRQDLAVLRIAKQAYFSSTSVNAEFINFSYPDQDSFEPTNQTDWDAEAFFVQNDSLVILTKQWVSQGTVAYKIPKTPGNHVAVKKDSYNVNGLVTGASFDPTKNQLYLIGYSQLLAPFFVQVDEVSDAAVFTGTKNKTNLLIGFAQTESIAFNGESKIYFTSEEFINQNPPVNTKARLFQFDLVVDNDELPPEEPIEPEPIEFNNLIIAKSSTSDLLQFKLEKNLAVEAVAIFDLSGKQVYYKPLELMPRSEIDTSFLTPSIYFIAFILNDGFVSKPFVVN